jgi:hypothetical protein
MTNLEQWKQKNKWLNLTDHFFGHRPKKNDLHTFAGLCQEIDTIWDEIFHNQDMMDKYIDCCDLQNILYTKYVLDGLKLRLNKLEMNLKYKGEALMGNVTGMQQETITRAKEYPMLNILEAFGCVVKRDRCKCPVHGGNNPTSFAIKENRGYCNSCHWKGDSIALYQELYKVDFVLAVKELQG